MTFYHDGIQFNILIDESKIQHDKIPILFLHGFTGSSEDWKFIFDKLPSNYLPFAIDIIGHGKTDSPENQKYYSCTAIVNQINELLNELNFKKIVIVGYSMGGRIALSYSLKHKDRVAGLFLESSTPGIDDIEEKKKRVEHDYLLAEKLKIDGVEPFLEFWFNTPFFESLKQLPNYEKIKSARSHNNPIGLANSLTSFSTGLMMSYWNYLPNLSMPTYLITGENDEKYTKINNKMRTKLPNSSHHIIPRTNHNTHLEKPELFTNLVLDFLTRLKGSNELKMDSSQKL